MVPVADLSSAFTNKDIPTAQTCDLRALNDYIELAYLNSKKKF